ncbi:DMT family transporter [Photobacterium sp. TY1-4]|uniref:DMT family transporter n=1 Tax=Photobacterium sp. TY1-4 TaxID=2899122 RepID=UPI0021C071E9|nr:DMT family transporter [Photobacterium sp. TY1-4]UXI03604.1 DMT family transporter [Photobacterium sp. TY1-4]
MKIYGGLLAVLAALFNGTVGLFSVNLFQLGLSSEAVAFYKCLIALMTLGVWAVMTGQLGVLGRYLRQFWPRIAVCAFFGFFVLYYFETAAYQHINVAVVVFCLFGASTIATFLLNAALARRWINKHELVAMLLSLGGLYLVFVETQQLSGQESTGLLLAVVAGLGYACFLVLTKKLGLGGGLIPVAALLLFGVIYLSIPLALSGWSVPSSDSLFALLMLAILPTIGGFWCTTKSLTLIESQSVQLIELTEPIFALIIGFVFLGQLVTGPQMLGGGLIMAAIVIHEFAVLDRLVLFRSSVGGKRFRWKWHEHQ